MSQGRLAEDDAEQADGEQAVAVKPTKPDWRRRLREEVTRLTLDRSRRVYAVVDGAFFDNLPALLSEKGIVHRSLYEDGVERGIMRVGPWLIDPYHLHVDAGSDDAAANDDGAAAHESGASEIGEPSEEATDEDLQAQADAAAEAMRAALEAGDETGGGMLPRIEAEPEQPLADAATQLLALLDVVGDAPTGVFWVGWSDLEPLDLRRHLRSLNSVLLPRESLPWWEGRDIAGETQAKGTHEAVTFRHADGNVLAQVLPVLDLDQFARLFGPAIELIFTAPDYPDSTGSPLRRALLPDEAPPPAAGLLSLDLEQVDGISGVRLERSRRKVADYLRDVDAPNTEDLSDAELRAAILRYEQSGEALGLRSERAQMKWAYMMSVSDGEIDRSPETRQFFRESSKHPDDRIDDLMDMADDAWRFSRESAS